MTEQLWAPVEGRYGRTRDGQKAGPMESSGYLTYEWTDPSGETWAYDGSYLIGHTNAADLVAEWRDEPQITLTNTQRLGEPLDGRPLEPSDSRAAPDLSDLREGDVVHVRMRVRSVGSVWLYVETLDGRSLANHVPIASVVSVQHRALKAGDPVVTDGKPAILKAVDGDEAFVRFDTGAYSAVPLACLKRAP